MQMIRHDDIAADINAPGLRFDDEGLESFMQSWVSK